MALSLEEITQRLSAIEAHEGMYEGIGPDEVPALEQLVDASEPWLAARAVFALSRVGSRTAANGLRKAAGHSRVEVRVAAAAAISDVLPSLEDDQTGDPLVDVIVSSLLDDANVGVRRYAIESATSAQGHNVRGKLQWIAKHDPAPMLRDSARGRLLAFRPGVYIDFDPAGPDVVHEHVVIRNNEDQPLDLGGWKLVDRAGHELTLPARTLQPGEEVRIWSGEGQSDEKNVFWGRKQAVWNNAGDLVQLVNPSGEEVVSFEYPG
jgi:hypothetical protein